MRKFKKITALILVLAIVIALPAVSFAEESASAVVTDSVPETYTTKMEILSALGIYSFADKPYNEKVTRAQFSRMIVDLMGLDENVMDNAVSFSDVTEETEYASAIKTLAAFGLVNGKGDGKFCPDENVTYLQALKIIVSVLGYHPAADASGGYSSGYVKCALDIGLIKNSPDKWDAPITFDLAAQLMLQTMETEIMEILEVNGERVRYAKSSGKLFMNVYHDIYLAEDRLTDNGITAVNGKSKLTENRVQIGSIILLNSNDKVRRFLGQTVNYYYRNDSGNYTLLYAYPTPDKNNTVTINADELCPDDNAFSKTCIVAKVNGKKKNFKIDKYADLLYNGAVDTSFTEETYKIKNGYLTLLDADNDGKYELVFAEEYVDIITASHFPDGKKITARYAPDGYSKIDYENYKAVVFENADGTEAIDVTAGCVLSVFRSKDDTKIRFVLSKKNKEIQVNAIEEDDADIYVFFDKDNAKLSDEYKRLMSEKPFLCPKPVSGNYYKAYFNYEGFISLLEETEGYTQYAYLLKIVKDSEPLGGSKVLFKMHTEDDVTLVATAKKKISIDKVSGQNPESLFSDRRIVDGNGDAIPQLVKVTVNSKAELSAIEIDTTVDSGPFGFDLERFSLDWSSGDNQWDPYIGHEARSIAGNHIISKNTKIFCVFTGDSLMQTDDETKVQAVNYANYLAYFARKAWTKGYDADETWELGAVVVGMSPTGYQYRTFTVEKAVDVKDPYGETKTQVTGWFAGRIMSYYEEDAGLFENVVKKRYPGSDGKLRKGDVLQVCFTSDSEIKMARLIYSPLRDNDPDYCFVEGTLANSDTYMLGYLCAAKDGRFSVYCKANENYVDTNGVASPTADSFWVNLWRTEGNIMLFDRETKEITKLSHYDSAVTSASLTGSEFTDFDTSIKVLAIRTSGQVYDVYIVK